jgi:hypothetical protein
MRFFGGLAGERPFAGELFPVAPFRAAASAWCTAWIIGALKVKSAPFTGVLTRSEAHSLDKAILVVGLPPIFFFIGIAYFVYRRRFAWRDDAKAETDSSADPTSGRDTASG